MDKSPSVAAAPLPARRPAQVSVMSLVGFVGFGLIAAPPPTCDLECLGESAGRLTSCQRVHQPRPTFPNP